VVGDWFFDDYECPFSIHNVTRIGTLSLGINVGAWFGPSSVSSAVSIISRECDLFPIEIYNAVDGSIYIEEIVSLCTRKGYWKPVLILIPIRLGVNSINPIYVAELYKLFQVSNFMGIIGGRPLFSYFFVGSQGENLFYLDPHLVQEQVPKRHLDLNTYSTEIVNNLNISELDESLCVGFYCHHEQDFNEFTFKTQQLNQPLFSILASKGNHNFDPVNDIGDDWNMDDF